MNSFIKQIERNIPAQSVMHPQSHQRLHSTTYWHVATSFKLGHDFKHFVLNLMRPHNGSA